MSATTRSPLATNARLSEDDLPSPMSFEEWLRKGGNSTNRHSPSSDRATPPSSRKRRATAIMQEVRTLHDTLEMELVLCSRDFHMLSVETGAPFRSSKCALFAWSMLEGRGGGNGVPCWGAWIGALWPARSMEISKPTCARHRLFNWIHLSGCPKP